MAKKGNGKAEKEPRPRQQRMPGTEDAAITELEDLAQEYVELRDERMKILAQEVEKKGQMLAAMKKHKRTTYNREGIEIEIESIGEKLKVHIRKEKDGDGEEVDMT